MWRAGLATALLCAAATAQTPDWSLIPTVAQAPKSVEVPPPGCTCVESATPCTKYECKCTCNLRAQQCDPNCCCDPECTAAEVSRFRSLGACLPEGPANRTLRSCVDMDANRALVYINPQPGMTVERSPSMENVLCIAVDNNPILGSYYADPGVQSADTLSDPAIARKYSYKAPAATTPPAPAAFYDVGDRLLAAAMPPGSSTLRSAYGGWWALPLAGAGGGPGGGGECALSGGGAYARYKQDVPLQQCSVVRPLDAATCEAVSVAALVEQVWVGASPQSTPTVTAAWLPITIKGVYTADAATGAVAVAPDAATAAAAVLSSWDAATCTCGGALSAVHYTVTYAASSNRIAAVAADVVVTTLTQAAGACGSVPLSIPLSVALSFSADTPPPAAAVSYAASNAARYGRSGAPGYRMGAPVLAGVLVSQSGADPLSPTGPSNADKLAVARSAASAELAALANATAGVASTASVAALGLHLRGPAPDGSCTPGAAATPVSVTFGEDMAVTCALSLSAAELAAACAGGGAGLAALVGLGQVNLTAAGVSLASAPGGMATVTHLGMYGNADPWKAWQWLAVDTRSAPASAIFDATTQACSGVLGGVDLELLYTRVGEASNPQAKILAARLRYPTTSWAFSRDDVRSAPAAAAARQRFYLKSTVTWVEYAPQRTVDYIPPAPPMLPRLPSDLFYPFETASTAQDESYLVSGAGATGAAGGPTAAAAATAALALVASAIAALRNGEY